MSFKIQEYFNNASYGLAVFSIKATCFQLAVMVTTGGLHLFKDFECIIVKGIVN